MIDKIHQCTFSTEQVLPDRPGVYFFFLSALHRSRVPEPPEFSCNKALGEYLDYMIFRIEKFVRLSEGMVWRGYIKEEERKSLGGRLDLEGRRVFDVNRIKLDIRRISCPEDMRVYVGSLNKAIILSGPIYVGMTEKQSIATRYGQHLRDSLSLDSEQKRFGNRLCSLGVSWGDLAIGYIDLPWGAAGLSRKIESGFHSITSPFLSVG